MGALRRRPGRQSRGGNDDGEACPPTVWRDDGENEHERENENEDEQEQEQEQEHEERGGLRADDVAHGHGAALPAAERAVKAQQDEDGPGERQPAGYAHAAAARPDQAEQQPQVPQG